MGLHSRNSSAAVCFKMREQLMLPHCLEQLECEILHIGPHLLGSKCAHQKVELSVT